MKTKLINSNINHDYGKNLLKERGIADVNLFLNPDERALQSWEDLDNIKDGINLIYSLRPTANIAILTDSDIDGYTSAAIIGQYLKRLLPLISIKYYLHSGKQHGFEDKWEEISESNFDLIIAPDAASNDSQFIYNFTCPVLIIDHHIVDNVNFTNNMVVINNQISQKYRNKELSGAGMTYQFCRAMDYYFERNWADDYIDLAATGCCGDMMSGLEVENQYLWRKGFSNINNYFLLTLARKQGYSITGKAGPSDEEIIAALNPTSVAFYIVPLVNAMVRVGTYEEKERMLLAFIDGHKMVPCHKRGAAGTYEEVAIESARECTNARTHQNKIRDDAVALLEQKIFKYDLLENKVLFVRLEDEDYPSELNGLIAMTLSQKYKRPTIVARLNNEGYVRGSARGLSNCELTSFKNYLDSTSLFEYAQGHDNAFGISIRNDELSNFHDRANRELDKYNFGETYYEVNFERNAYSDDLTELIDDLANYKSVWSQKCNEPYIHVKNIHITKDDIQIMGKNKDTVKIFKNGVAYMKFFAKDMIEELNNFGQMELEIVGTANLNEFRGVITPQIFIENYEIKDDSILRF